MPRIVKPPQRFFIFLTVYDVKNFNPITDLDPCVQIQICLAMQYYNCLTQWLQNGNPITIGNIFTHFTPYLTYFVCGMYEVRDKAKINEFFIAHNIIN